MASQVPAAAGKVAKAIYAAPHFIKAGEGASAQLNVTKEIVLSLVTGIGLGLTWKTWHWNEKRKLAQYYHDLAAKELADEQERKAALQAKIEELSDSILS